MKKFKLINEFEFDKEENIITVTGGRRVLEEGCKYHIEDMEETLTIDEFIDFCKICILSEQCNSEQVDIAKYGVSFERTSFDHRFFTKGKLQLFLGEAYVMYEILRHNIDTSKFKMHKIFYTYVFISPKGYVILSDKYMLRVGVFRYHLFEGVQFNPGDKPRKDEVGYDREVEIGQIQTIRMTKGACHPYVELKYRDMVISMSLDDWKKLKELCHYYLCYYNEDEDDY